MTLSRAIGKTHLCPQCEMLQLVVSLGGLLPREFLGPGYPDPGRPHQTWGVLGDSRDPEPNSVSCPPAPCRSLAESLSSVEGSVQGVRRGRVMEGPRTSQSP